MTTQKQILNSHSPSVAMPAGRDRGPYSAHYAVNDGYRGWILLLIILVALGGAALVFAQNAAAQTKANKTQYHVSTLASLGGTSSGGNSINDQSWAAGYSRLPDRNRHATLWRNSLLTDLYTLGGPNSSVTWNVKNTAGIIVGISQTLTPEPLGESWSSAAFYSTPNNVGYINLGFVWQNNQMGTPPISGRQ